MKKIVIIFSSLIGCFFLVKSILPILIVSKIQNSHIEANIPDSSQFANFIKRDLLDYSKTTIEQSATSVEYKLLRDAPTQSGVSLPKYYLWLKILSNDRIIKEGAIRVAAINNQRFEVTHFLIKENIRSHPEKIDKIFPSLLKDNILVLANTSDAK
jgi:hypothetical protein